MDKHSEQLLQHVHPDLVKVIRSADQTSQSFIVVYGIRTLAAEKIAVATGHSQTMHSRHLPNKNGVACAVDLAALDKNGHIDWASGHESSVYGKIWAEIQASAKKLNVPVEWGGYWKKPADFGHVQLSWSSYT